MVRGRRRGISAAVGELILVGVTVSLAFVMAMYIKSVWHTEAEEFILTPILSMRSSSSAVNGSLVLELHIRNEGQREAVILKVEVRSSEGAWVNSSRIVVPPGSSLDVVIDEWVWVGQDGPPTPVRGEKYRVLVYTEGSGVLMYDVVLS